MREERRCEEGGVDAAARLPPTPSSLPPSRNLVLQTQGLAEVYISLAAEVPPPEGGGGAPFPAHLARAAAQFTAVPVASIPLDPRPDRDYSHVPRFAGFGPLVEGVGGINRPKKVVARDDAGGAHAELVKAGHDDLRQDAVMQQFFALVNALLAADRECAGRGLNVRTYKAVPFTPSAGVIQWVDRTAPLSTWLIGADRRSGAHARRAPAGTMTHAAASAELQAAPADALRAAFDRVCAAFPPVLRHFFTETFPNPPAWHAARTTYARSAAVASVAGYVAGLGDRHSHNILLDTATAAVVHIDLGVAFEQGAVLPTPELVPFRLTRDVVDGLGAAGADGPFRRVCEATLGVLRRAREPVTTVVEVLVHDPLYRWKATAAVGGGGPGAGAGAADADGAPAPTVNPDAERALLRVRAKLAGLDGGDGGARGVGAQVTALLRDAADPGKLCRMYVGWAPWL